MDDSVPMIKCTNDVVTALDSISSPDNENPLQHDAAPLLDPLVDVMRNSSEPYRARLSKARLMCTAYADFKRQNTPQNFYRVERAYHSFTRAHNTNASEVSSASVSSSCSSSNDGRLSEVEQYSDGRCLEDVREVLNGTDLSFIEDTLSMQPLRDIPRIALSPDGAINRLNRRINVVKALRTSLDSQRQLREMEQRVKELEGCLLEQQVNGSMIGKSAISSSHGELIIKVRTQADPFTSVALIFVLVLFMWFIAVIIGSRRFPMVLS